MAKQQVRLSHHNGPRLPIAMFDPHKLSQKGFLHAGNDPGA